MPDKIEHNQKRLVLKSELINAIKQSKATVLLTIGAGDIGEEVKHIKNALSIAS